MAYTEPRHTVLALIVKDEAQTIAKTLDSARRSLGPGPTVIHDTGSTDHTIEAVELWAKRHAVGVTTIASRPFDDFSHARNACLAHAFEHGDRVCMVDASVIVSGTLLPGDGPAFATLLMGNMTWTRPQIFVPGWEYHGAVHEYATGPGLPKDSGLTFAYSLPDGGSRARRWLRDLALLEGDFSPRGRFYYAQTLDCLGRKSQAEPAYVERYNISESGFWEERVIAMLRCIPMTRDYAMAERYAGRALALDATRGEVWLALAERAPTPRERYRLASKAIETVPRAGALFIEGDREWKAHLCAGDASADLGHFGTARRHWRDAVRLAGDRMDPHERAELQAGIRMTERKPVSA